MSHKYPLKYGFRVSVEIVRANGIARVILHTPLYVNKQTDMQFSYSADFTDSEILRDSRLKLRLTQMFGVPD